MEMIWDFLDPDGILDTVENLGIFKNSIEMFQQLKKDIRSQAFNEDISIESLTDEQLTEIVRESVISLDIEIGDIILGGKYKNKRTEVKEIGEDELGQPTINGKPILKFRIEKKLPDSKKSKKTLDLEKEEK